MVGDKISNLINGLKNASERGLESIEIPASNTIEAILNTLKKEGYVADFEKKGKDPKKSFKVFVKYSDSKEPAVRGAKRVSKQSRRIYKNVKEIKPVQNGYGDLILSTPKGILSGKDAKNAKVGGEALFEIW